MEKSYQDNQRKKGLYDQNTFHKSFGLGNPQNKSSEESQLLSVSVLGTNTWEEDLFRHQDSFIIRAYGYTVAINIFRL